MRNITLGITMAALLTTTGVSAQRVAFLRHNPREDLSQVKVGRGSTTITTQQMESMSLGDLLEFDVLYIEGIGTGWKAALKKKELISLAVQLGLSLYIVGSDPAVFEVAPVSVNMSGALGTSETRIPVSAAWSIMGFSSFLETIHAAKAGPVERAFTRVPNGFVALQEVRVGKHQYLPVVMAGNVGYGRVILRTTPWAPGAKVNSHTDAPTVSMISWLSQDLREDTVLNASTMQLASTEEF